jgi:hypothetical protein
MAAMIIGLCGYPGVGKDEIAKTLQFHGFARVAFADPMREALLAIDPLVDTDPLCMPLSELVSAWGWDMVKRTCPGVRLYLQRIGTEAGRNIHGEDCWVKIACRRIDAIKAPVVVTDVRFANEVEALRARGAAIWHVTRPGVGRVNNHSSEALDYAAIADRRIDNAAGIKELTAAVERAIGIG